MFDKIRGTFPTLPSTLDIMYSHQKFAKNVGEPQKCLKIKAKSLNFQ